MTEWRGCGRSVRGPPEPHPKRNLHLDAHRDDLGVVFLVGNSAGLAKSGYTEPTFWRPDQQGSKKRWHAKPGDKNKLTPHEEAVLSALNELLPNGELDHKAKRRNDRINQFLVNSGRSKVSPRVIQRTLAKIAFG
jgi:hypothetical protein